MASIKLDEERIHRGYVRERAIIYHDRRHDRRDDRCDPRAGRLTAASHVGSPIERLVGVRAVRAATYMLVGLLTSALPACRNGRAECTLPTPTGDLTRDIDAIRQVSAAYGAFAAARPDPPNKSHKIEEAPIEVQARDYCEALLIRKVAPIHQVPLNDLASRVAPGNERLLRLLGAAPGHPPIRSGDAATLKGVSGL